MTTDLEQKHRADFASVITDIKRAYEQLLGHASRSTRVRVPAPGNCLQRSLPPQRAERAPLWWAGRATCAGAVQASKCRSPGGKGRDSKNRFVYRSFAINAP